MNEWRTVVPDRRLIRWEPRDNRRKISPLLWCAECKEARAKRRSIRWDGKNGHWVVSYGGWTRSPWGQWFSGYVTTETKLSKYIEPPVPLSEIDFTSDKFSSDVSLARAKVKLAIWIASRREEEAASRRMAEAFDVPVTLLDDGSGSYASAENFHYLFLKQQQLLFDHYQHQVNFYLSNVSTSVNDIPIKTPDQGD